MVNILPYYDESITHRKEVIYKDIIDGYNDYLSTGTKPYHTFITENYREICMYLFEHKYKLTDNELKKISRKWIKEHKLYGLLTHHFRGNIYDLINDIYPERFKPWDFTTVGSEYWKDENNIKYALNWLINKLYDDKIINSESDIPKVISQELIQQYGLGGLLSIYFNGYHDMINYIFPNKFKAWEFNHLPSEYWNDKKNRIDYFKHYIENELYLSIEDIPKVLSFMYLSYNKHALIRIIMDYYNSDIYNYINEIYPNVFSKNEFAYQNHYPTLDGIVVRSEQERMIQHLFIKNKINAKYEHDSIKHNDGYYKPDWMLYHNDEKIIIEYYGMIQSSEDLFGYNDKYNKKNTFYNELIERDNTYKYIPLFESDIKNNFTGLIDKFNNIGIIIKVN